MFTGNIRGTNALLQYTDRLAEFLMYVFHSLQEYQQILDLMRDNILATDLQHHFDILPALRNLAESKSLTLHNILNALVY